MITGVVTWRNEATLQISVYDAANSTSEVDVEAVIDTGFTGYLCLPQSAIDALSLPFLKTDTYELGDGSTVVFRLYEAVVDWNGERRSILVLAAEGGALVGMNLLKGTHFSMHVVDGGLVTIEV